MQGCKADLSAGHPVVGPGGCHAVLIRIHVRVWRWASWGAARRRARLVTAVQLVSAAEAWVALQATPETGHREAASSRAARVQTTWWDAKAPDTASASIRSA